MNVAQGTLILMIVMTQPGLSRGGYVASTAQLPELVAHWSGASLTGSLNVWNNVTLLNATGVTIVGGIGSGSAFDIASGQSLKTDINANVAYNRAYATGRGDWTIGARIKLDTPIANDYHTILSWGGDQFRGVEFNAAPTNLYVVSADIGASLDTLAGPAIDGGRWWSVVAQFNSTTLKIKIYAIDDSNDLSVTESATLTERDLWLYDRLFIGNDSTDRALRGKICDVFWAKAVWTQAKILEWHNSGTPLNLDGYAPPSLAVPAAPWSNVAITENWLNTTTTGTPGIYWYRPWRMPSNQLRVFFSADHGNPATSPSVLTGITTDPATPPASFTGLNTPLDATLTGPDGNYHVSNAETPTYLHVPGDANGRPHYLYANYVCTSWPTQGGAPTAGLSDLEITVLFSSASESFSSLTYEGVALPGSVASPFNFNWLGYARVYSDLPGVSGYRAYHLGNRITNISYMTPSNDPKLFPVGNADSVMLDDATVMPAQSTPCYWKEGIFSPDGVNVYAVGHGVLVKLEQDDDGEWTRPIPGYAWNLPFPASASFAQGWTSFYEAGKLYVWRLLGFFPDDGYEQLDLMVADFPG